mmetsp:Transcript_33992/g.84018  ORF Transcript_33992/g.84018 Transcript_33992/m.84018 type:complete len:245 (-) Transcript_33992:861-1595(-)
MHQLNQICGSLDAAVGLHDSAHPLHSEGVGRLGQHLSYVSVEGRAVDSEAVHVHARPKGCHTPTHVQLVTSERHAHDGGARPYALVHAVAATVAEEDLDLLVGQGSGGRDPRLDVEEVRRRPLAFRRKEVPLVLGEGPQDAPLRLLTWQGTQPSDHSAGQLCVDLKDGSQADVDDGQVRSVQPFFHWWLQVGWAERFGAQDRTRVLQQWWGMERPIHPRHTVDHLHCSAGHLRVDGLDGVSGDG